MPNLCHLHARRTHTTIYQSFKSKKTKIQNKKYPTKMIGYTIKMKINFSKNTSAPRTYGATEQNPDYNIYICYRLLIKHQRI